MGPSQCPDDYTFGPIVQGCRDTFDFSLKFEKVFLAIIPACLLVVFSLARTGRRKTWSPARTKMEAWEGRGTVRTMKLTSANV